MNPEVPDISVPLFPLIAHLIKNGHGQVARELLTRWIVSSL